MMVKRGYQAELDLNNAQITLARKHCGAARWAYNYGLRRKQEAYTAGEKTLYATDLHREINALKKTELSWMYEFPSARLKRRSGTSTALSSISFAKSNGKSRASGKANVAIPSVNPRRKPLVVRVSLALSTSILMRSSYRASDCSDSRNTTTSP